MESNQFFGVPLANIKSAEARVVGSKQRLNVRVPRRKEVSSLPSSELRYLLVEWMTHSATEIIPSKAQIYEVLTVLRARDDFSEIQDVAEMCANYVHGD